MANDFTETGYRLPDGFSLYDVVERHILGKDYAPTYETTQSYYCALVRILFLPVIRDQYSWLSSLRQNDNRGLWLRDGEWWMDPLFCDILGEMFNDFDNRGTWRKGLEKASLATEGGEGGRNKALFGFLRTAAERGLLKIIGSRSVSHNMYNRTREAVIDNQYVERPIFLHKKNEHQAEIKKQKKKNEPHYTPPGTHDFGAWPMGIGMTGNGLAVGIFFASPSGECKYFPFPLPTAGELHPVFLQIFAKWHVALRILQLHEAAMCGWGISEVVRTEIVTGDRNTDENSSGAVQIKDEAQQPLRFDCEIDRAVKQVIRWLAKQIPSVKMQFLRLTLWDGEPLAATLSDEWPKRYADKHYVQAFGTSVQTVSDNQKKIFPGLRQVATDCGLDADQGGFDLILALREKFFADRPEFLTNAAFKIDKKGNLILTADQKMALQAKAKTI